MSTTRRGRPLVIHLVVLLSVAVLAPSVGVAADAATAAASYATPVSGLSGGQAVVDGAGHAYATNRSQNRVEVLSLTTHALEAPIAVGSSPVSLDLSPDRTTLYVANYDSNDVSVVDLSLRREVRRIAMPDPGHPSSIAIAANGTALLARAAAGGSSDAPTLAQIDLSSGAVRARTDWLPYTLSLDTVRVQASGDRSRIGIVRSLGSASFYDTATDGFTAEKVLGSGGFLAVDNAGSKLIAGGPDTLVLDGDLVLRATIPGPGTIALALNGAGTVGYRLRGTQVDVLDLSRALATASIALPDPPSQYAGSLALTPDGSTLVALTGNGFSVVPTSAATPVPCVAPAAPAQVLPVCGAPLADLVADGRGRAYVSNPTRNQVEVVSLGSRSLEAPIAVGSQPGSLDLSPDGNTLYVVDTGAQEVSVVDLSARREVRRITVPFATSTERLFSIAVGDNGTALLTTRSPADGLGQRLVQVVLATGTVSERTDIPVAKPLYLEASGDHRRIAALVGDAPGGMLFEYVAGKDSFTPPKFVSAGLSEIAMDGDGSELLVGPGNYDYDPGVYRLDQDLVRRGTIDPFGDGLAISPSGTTAYTVFGHTLGIIDVQRNLTVRWVPLPEGLASKPGALVPTPDGGAVAIVTTSGIAFASTTAGYAVPGCGSAYLAGQVTAVCGGLSDVVTDGTGHAYVSNPERNEIDVVSLADGTPEAPIPVGSRPRGLDLSADGTKLYVADSGAEDISVVDLALRRETHRITVPSTSYNDRPFSIAVANNGTALFSTTFSGSGYGGTLSQLDLAHETAAVRSDFGVARGATGEATVLRASGDRSHIAVVEDHFSDGPVAMYTAATGSFTPQSQRQEYLTAVAVDGTGSTVLVDPGTYVLDGAAQSRAVIPSGGKGIAVNRAGTTAYRVQDGAVEVLDVQRQAVVRTIPLPELASDQGRGAVALSADEKTLAVVTNSGLSVVHLDRMAQQGAYSVWSQPSAMPLDGLGAWTAIANDAAAGSGQQPASYLYGQYFTFIGSSSLGMVGLVTQPSGKFAVFSVVDPDGTQHVAAVRFNWTAGRLYFPFVYQLAPGSWGAWVYDNSAATWVPIGLLTLPADFGRLAPASMTLSTWVGAPAPACSSYPSADVLYYPAQGYVGGTGAVATLATSGQTPGECPASATVAHGVWAYHHLGT